jgi:hypothetical protein
MDKKMIETSNFGNFMDEKTNRCEDTLSDVANTAILMTLDGFKFSTEDIYKKYGKKITKIGQETGEEIFVEYRTWGTHKIPVQKIDKKGVAYTAYVKESFEYDEKTGDVELALFPYHMTIIDLYTYKVFGDKILIQNGYKKNLTNKNDVEEFREHLSELSKDNYIIINEHGDHPQVAIIKGMAEVSVEYVNSLFEHENVDIYLLSSDNDESKFVELLEMLEERWKNEAN